MKTKEQLQREWDIQQLKTRIENLNTGFGLDLFTLDFYEREILKARQELKFLLSRGNK